DGGRASPRGAGQRQERHREQNTHASHMQGKPMLDPEKTSHSPSSSQFEFVATPRPDSSGKRHGTASAPLSRKHYRAPRSGSSMRAVMYAPTTPALRRGRPRPAPVLPGAVVVALTRGACGTTRTKANLTKAQFTARADAICRMTDAKLAYIRQLAEKLGRAPSAPPVMRQE